MHRLNTKCILRKTQNTITKFVAERRGRALSSHASDLEVVDSVLDLYTSYPDAALRGIPELLWTNVSRAPQGG